MRNTIELKDGKSKREKLVNNQSNIIRYHRYYVITNLFNISIGFQGTMVLFGGHIDKF
jgi:hypothetical protein